MADISQITQQFLCYGNSDCANLFNQYTYQPMEGIFYLIFFPIVFIIVFIFLLSNKLFGGHKGLKILISVAFFAFIILQGWYYWFMQLGKIWYIGIIILGFFWLLLYGLRGGIGGSGGAQARAGGASKASSILTQTIAALRDKATGVTGSTLQMLETDLDILRSTPPGAHGIDEITNRINGTMREIRGNLPLYHLNKGRFDELRKEYIQIAKEKGIHDVEKTLPKAA